MRLPTGGGKVRRHLVLSAFLWEALEAEARRRQVRISQLTQEMVLRGLRGADLVNPPDLSGTGQLQRNGRRYYCRLSVDRSLWLIMAQEAGELGCSVPEIIRRRLQATGRVDTTRRDLLPSAPLPAAAPAGPAARLPLSGAPRYGPAEDGLAPKRLPIFDLDD